MASCNQCGACCAVIGIKQDQDEINHFADKYAPDIILLLGNNSNAYNYWFVQQNWENISSSQAIATNPLMANRENCHFYTCKKFDKEKKLCTVHYTKPRVCSGFPWYGGQVNAHTLTEFPDCSYWEDVKPINIC